MRPIRGRWGTGSMAATVLMTLVMLEGTAAAEELVPAATGADLVVEVLGTPVEGVTLPETRGKSLRSAEDLRDAVLATRSSLAQDAAAAARARDSEQRTAPDVASTPAAEEGWPSAESLQRMAVDNGGGDVTWVLKDKGHWGVADWYNNTIYVAPRVPKERARSVVVHELAHIRQYQAYDGEVLTLAEDTNQTFGGSGVLGVELAADCMAILKGATWTNYTQCENPVQREAAKELWEGRRLR